MTGSTQRQWLDEVGHVLETLNQDVIINDDRNCVAFANSTFLEMIKMRREELLGRAVIELFPPADVARLLEFIGRRETEGRARYEFYIPRADGQRQRETDADGPGYLSRYRREHSREPYRARTCRG